MPAFRFDPTPNPNSLKFSAPKEVTFTDGMESFASAAEAESHPLGHRLFSLPGVTNVFMLPQFATITKQPAADWELLIPKIQAVLQQHFGIDNDAA